MTVRKSCSVKWWDKIRDGTFSGWHLPILKFAPLIIRVYFEILARNKTVLSINSGVMYGKRKAYRVTVQRLFAGTVMGNPHNLQSKQWK